MKVVLLGAGGQLGRSVQELQPEGVELISFTSAELDITNELQITEKLDAARPNVIINAAAYTQVDKAEEEPELAFRVNALGPQLIAQWVANNDSRLIHISTDFVFDGEKTTPYVETDKPNPVNVYGKSKLEGENNVLALIPDKAAVVRTSWLYSNHGANFMNTMLRLFEERDSLSIVDDQVGSPTTTSALADVLWKLVGRADINGLYHWSCEGEVSWFGFAEAIKDEAGVIRGLEANVELLAITSDQYSALAVRPKYSVLSSSKLDALIAEPAIHWRELLIVELNNS
ncbi:MAG: dTDP-4-dehydrorhamnose reductase [Gammaproteobacteria bacterium]|nr:MAG: dTDP-4-dehydrorhamnose reductase [Gammaproteobacteria bacterium]